MRKDIYQKVEGFDHKLKPCPFCGHHAELWDLQRSEKVFVKVAMCSNNGEGFGDDDCPMYMPNEGFYKARKREAIEVWNTRSPEPPPTKGDKE